MAGFDDRRVELDAEGVGRLDEVPAGDCRVFVSTVNRWYSARGYGLPCVEDVDVPPAGVVNVRGRVLEGGRIRLTVRDARGKPVVPRGAEVFDLKGERINTRFIQVNTDGTWFKHIREPGPVLLGKPLPPGRYIVKVHRDDAPAGEAEVLVDRGRTVDLEIR